MLFYGLLAIVLVAVYSSAAHGTSVRAVSVAEMLQQSEFVFEGRVMGLRPDQDPSSGIIRTYVSFEILDVLKGEYSSDTIMLSFMGGTVGGATLAVGDMQIPEIDEKGVYFVESLQRRQVHPFYGWSQGHFLVVADEQGVERVLTKARRPVAAMESRPEIQVKGLSGGTAGGVTVTEGDYRTDAMTITDFKQRLSTMLRALQ
jgi:hypothetical protein